MRVWDIHPGYLSRQSLLGQHAEIHAVHAVIIDQKKGYSAHPETRRWRDNLGLLKRVHDLTVLEMKLRGFNHNSPFPENYFYKEEFYRQEEAVEEVNVPIYVDRPAEQVMILREKYLQRQQEGRIPLPKNIFKFWAHHKYSVMARGYNCYKDIQLLLNENDQCSIAKTGIELEKIMLMMNLPVTVPALKNTADHLWGYFKQTADREEKDKYLQIKEKGPLPELVPYLHKLALKYDCIYLQHSTIFADFTGNAELKESKNCDS